MYVFRDRLEIRSPGRLPNTLNLEKFSRAILRQEISFSYSIWINMKYIDGLGRGVPMIARETKGNFLSSEEGEILRLVLPFQAPFPTR